MIDGKVEEETIKVENYPSVSLFRGKSILALSERFSFGIKKAKLIVENYETIKKFVEDYET